jgi:hypothetical protein
MCFDGYNTRCRNEGQCYISNIDAYKEKIYDIMLQVHRNSNQGMNLHEHASSWEMETLYTPPSTYSV